MGDLGIGQGRCPQCENGKCGSIEENHHWKESVSGDRRGRSELGHGYSDPRDAPRRIWRLRRQRLRTANTPSRTHPPIPFQCWEIERERERVSHTNTVIDRKRGLVCGLICVLWNSSVLCLFAFQEKKEKREREGYNW